MWAGIRPKSVFQIGGAGAVGTGSLRGMASLHALHQAGFAVWPFQERAQATLIEIYPRTLTGKVIKSSAEERRSYLARWPEMSSKMRDTAAATEDAFDAAVSALVMWAHRDELAMLADARDDIERLEGAIWTPPCGGSATHARHRGVHAPMSTRQHDASQRRNV